MLVNQPSAFIGVSHKRAATKCRYLLFGLAECICNYVSSIIRTVKLSHASENKNLGQVGICFVVVVAMWCSEFVLEQEQVVGCGNSDHIFCRMPSRMQDLLIEVQTVNVYLVFSALATRTDLLKENNNDDSW